MRIKLTLAATNRSEFFKIPINYQYPLSAAIYKILNSGSPEYARFLHDQGYKTPDGRLSKLFTFSYLTIPHKRIEAGIFVVPTSLPMTLFISSPMLDGFVQHLVMGAFAQQRIDIAGHGQRNSFLITQVEAIPAPEFSPVTHFICQSPFVVSTIHERDGKLRPYYLRPDDPNLSTAVRKNLIQKYYAIHQQSPVDDALEFSLDSGYISRRGGPDKVTKLITLKEGHTTAETRIKSIFAPFTLTGSPDLMRTAWEAGLGEHCSQGFGCVETTGKK